MKILILGCSHSLGSWRKSTSFKNQKDYDVNNSWVAHLCRQYNEHQFINFSHPAGGIFNYTITLSYLKKDGLLDKIDKVIIQNTNEVRLTLYHVDKFSFENETEISLYNNNYPYNIETPTKYKNYKLYNFANFKKSENSSYNYNSFELQDSESICKKVLDTDDINIKTKLKNLYDGNFYVDFIHKNLSHLIEHVILKDKELYTFNWMLGENSIYNLINNISDNLYHRISSKVDNYHLDSYGNKLVFELLKDDLDKFIKK